MKTVIHKSSAVGCSTTPIFPLKFKLKLGHFVFQLPEPFKGKIGKAFGRDFTMIMSQIALVENEVTLPEQIKEPINVPVFGNRFSDVVDLNAFILFFGVRKKKDMVEIFYLGRQINKFTLWALPYAMEFGLDENLRPLPNGPANMLFAAVSNNILWNDSKTFIKWFSNQGPRWDKERLVLRKLTAK